MDTFSLVVILLIAFIAYANGIWWLFLGMLVLFIITMRSKALIALTLAGFGIMYFLKLEQHWFIFMIVVLGLAVAINERNKPAGGQEYMSPELMQLLSGGGDHGY